MPRPGPTAGHTQLNNKARQCSVDKKRAFLLLLPATFSLRKDESQGAEGDVT
jgi:hypothetical protein